MKSIWADLIGSNMKLVLDVCCGSKMFWFDKNDPRCIFMDLRKERHILVDANRKNRKVCDVNPGIIGSYENLPFMDETFHMVIFDPPHLSRCGPNGWMRKKYGRLGAGWESSIANGFSECFRVLKQYGTLVFKWNSTQIPVSKILKLTPVVPLVGNKCGKSAKTHWMVFIK